MEAKVLEEFEGFVERFEGDIAYVTLKSTLGDVLWGEYSVDKLTALGIHERRRFKCKTVEIGNSVEIFLEAIPDCEVDYNRINKELEFLNIPTDDWDD